MFKLNLYLLIIILSSIFLTSCSINKIQRGPTSFSYIFNIKRLCYIYRVEEHYQDKPFPYGHPQSIIESTYLLQFSFGSNPQQSYLTIVRQKGVQKTNEISDDLKTLENIVLESDFMTRTDLEKVEYAKFFIQKTDGIELSIIDIEAEQDMVIEEDNLVQELKYVIDSIYSPNASNIKWLYPLEQDHNDSDSVYTSHIIINIYGYDIKLPIIVYHSTDNSYSTSDSRNEKIFHKTTSFAANEIYISETDWQIRFGTITNYLLIEHFEPK